MAEYGEDIVFKTVPREYEKEIVQAMVDADIPFISSRGDHNYLSVYTLGKYADSFLKVQSEIFKIDASKIDEQITNQKQNTHKNEVDYDER